VNSEAMSLSVIIPTKNRPADLESTVRSLLLQSVLPQQLVILDQSADNKSQQKVQALFDALPSAVGGRLKLTYEMDGAISGLAMARNRSMTLAEGDVWLFLDDDVVMEPNFVEELCKVYARFPHAVGVSGIITNYPRPPWASWLFRMIFLRGPFHDRRQSEYWRADRLRHREPIRTDRLGGGLMSFRADAVRSYLFDEGLQGVSDGEDVDFCVRLGPDAVLLIAPAARLEHRQSPKGRLRNHHLHRQARSICFLYWKNWHHGFWNRLCFAWLGTGFALLATIGSLRRFSLEPWRALFAGVRDAKDARRRAGAHRRNEGESAPRSHER